MNLQGRNLSVQMQGDDVNLLQSEQARLAFSIARDEIQQAFFSPGTRHAMVDFKKRCK